MLRSGGRIAIVDRFLGKQEQPSNARRLVNLVTGTLFSDINRGWGRWFMEPESSLTATSPRGRWHVPEYHALEAVRGMALILSTRNESAYSGQRA